MFHSFLRCHFLIFFCLGVTLLGVGGFDSFKRIHPLYVCQYLLLFYGRTEEAQRVGRQDW